MLVPGGRVDIYDSKEYIHTERKTVQSYHANFEKNWLAHLLFIASWICYFQINTTILAIQQLNALDKLFDRAYPQHNLPKWEGKFDTAKYIRGPWQTGNECGLSILRFLQWYDGDRIQCKDDQVS